MSEARYDGLRECYERMCVGLVLEHFEELERREYPYTVALRCRR